MISINICKHCVFVQSAQKHYIYMIASSTGRPLCKLCSSRLLNSFKQDLRVDCTASACRTSPNSELPPQHAILVEIIMDTESVLIVLSSTMSLSPIGHGPRRLCMHPHRTSTLNLLCKGV